MKPLKTHKRRKIMIEAREIKLNPIHICIEDTHMRRALWLDLPESIDTDTILRNIGISLLKMANVNTDKIDSDTILAMVDKIAVELDEY